MEDKLSKPQEIIVEDLLEQGFPGFQHNLSTLQFVKLYISDRYELHCVLYIKSNGKQSGRQYIIQREGDDKYDIRVSYPYETLELKKIKALGEVPPISLNISCISDEITGEYENFLFGEINLEHLSAKNIRIIMRNGILEGPVRQNLFLFVEKIPINYPLKIELYDFDGVCVYCYYIKK